MIRRWCRDGLGSGHIDEGSEFIRGPKWRTRTTPRRRARAAAVTFAAVVATGAVLLGGVIWVLAWLGAPQFLGAAAWALPTIGVVAWVLVRPRPAVATDDDDDAWTTYSIQYVLVGEGEPRPAPLRLIAALLFGAPVVWSLFVFGLSTLAGLF